MKTLGKLLLFVFSFLLSALAAYHLWLKDWPLVWILMASILLHELGHWLAMVFYGLKPSMFFVPLLGAAVSAPDMEKKLDYEQQAIVSLAGPSANFLLLGFGLLLSLKGSSYGLKIASLNAGLAWFNLIPLLILDGKKFLDNIYSSLDEEADDSVASIISAIAILVGIGLAFAGRLSFFYLLIYLGAKWRADEDDPADAYSRKAMSEQAASSLVSIYAVVMFSSMIAAALLPFWFS